MRKFLFTILITVCAFFTFLLMNVALSCFGDDLFSSAILSLALSIIPCLGAVSAYLAYNKRETPPAPEKEDAFSPEKRVYGPLDPPEKWRHAPLEQTPGIHLNAKHVFRVLFIVFMVGIAGIFSYQTVRVVQLQDGLDSLSSAYENLHNEYETVQEEYTQLRADYIKMETEYKEIKDTSQYYDSDLFNDIVSESAFLRHNIGFIVDGSDYYHNCRCGEIKNADRYWAHNIEFCESLGYAPCPNCW